MSFWRDDKTAVGGRIVIGVGGLGDDRLIGFNPFYIQFPLGLRYVNSNYLVVRYEQPDLTAPQQRTPPALKQYRDSERYRDLDPTLRVSWKKVIPLHPSG